VFCDAWVINRNMDQTNLAQGGIAVASPRNSSFVFARWQQQFAIFGCWLDPIGLYFFPGQLDNRADIFFILWF